MSKLEIVICTEKGYLESMSKLLIASLREFGGKFKDVPIYSYQPRKGLKISSESISFFEKNNVVHVDLELNHKFPHYPLANKPFVCAHREMHSDADILVFLDTDIFFFNEPSEFIEFDNADVMLRPVDGKNIGAQNLKDKHGEYWNNLYKQLNVKSHRYVKTTVTEHDVLEYYNSGCIVTKRNNNLFNSWNENFLKVMDSDIRPGSSLYFVEQSVFSATVSQMELDVKALNKEYNYPIQLEHQIRNEEYIVHDFNSLVCVHYHNIFRNEKKTNPIEKYLATEKGEKLNKLINDFNIIC